MLFYQENIIFKNTSKIRQNLQNRSPNILVTQPNTGIARTQYYGSDSYRNQGQEKDDAVKGRGNSVNYKYRMHDPRLGRFFAVDPLAQFFPHNSPFAFSENEVINTLELEGLGRVHYLEKKEDGTWGAVKINGKDWIDVISDLDENVNCYLYGWTNGSGVKEAVYKSHQQGGKDRWVHRNGVASDETLRQHYDHDRNLGASANGLKPASGKSSTFFDKLFGDWSGGHDGALNGGWGGNAEKELKYGFTMIVGIVTIGQGKALVAGGTKLLSAKGLSLAIDLAIIAGGILDYSSNFNEAGKKIFQVLSVLKGKGNIMTQVKVNSLDILDTVGNILGTLSVADNVIQLDGNESLFKILGDEASK